MQAPGKKGERKEAFIIQEIQDVEDGFIRKVNKADPGYRGIWCAIGVSRGVMAGPAVDMPSTLTSSSMFTPMDILWKPRRRSI